MTGRDVVVLANLKGKKMGGFTSTGMVVCASNAAHDHVLFVDPPEGTSPGDLVTFEGFPSAPASAAQVVKKKMLENLFPDLKTGVGGACLWRGSLFQVEGKGPCSCTGAAEGYSIS
mmetsp:Transcript_86998/g.168492  ORF Transcript_86998/g.168492 Transcript_86998/m.168492 type:complete len:116 (-) Transcript_86998:243-590(-)